MALAAGFRFMGPQGIYMVDYYVYPFKKIISKIEFVNFYIYPNILTIDYLKNTTTINKIILKFI